MVKVLVDKYPMGSLPGQQTAGRYMDDYLRSNIDVLAKNIANDMQFLGIVSSSTFEVRSGKSTLIQHFGEYYTDSVNRHHGTKLTFSMKNIVFGIDDFIQRAFELPKYSILLLDENDEVDEHYFSEMATKLRKFLKKAGQLNLTMIIIVPDFFQLKRGLAVQRSNFLIDVKFQGEFERGYFSFYSFENKRELYIKGKKEYNWKVCSPNFSGRFTKGYAVDKDEYLKAKLEDLKKSEEKEKKPEIKLKDKQEEYAAGIYLTFKDKIPSQELIAGVCKVFKVSKSTLYERISLGKQHLVPLPASEHNSISYPLKNEITEKEVAGKNFIVNY